VLVPPTNILRQQSVSTHRERTLFEPQSYERRAPGPSVEPHHDRVVERVGLALGEEVPAKPSADGACKRTSENECKDRGSQSFIQCKLMSTSSYMYRVAKR
jgi:hypothetical protein